MKTEKKKSKESLIGKIIYGFLLFMPLLSVLVTCLYVIQNDNAHESYYGETINEENINYLNNSSDTDPSIIYYYESSMVIDTNYSGTITYNRAEYVSSTNTLTEQQLNLINSSTRMYFYRGTSTTFYDSENNSVIIAGGPIIVKLHNVTMDANTSGYRALYYLTYNKNSYLDDAFMYGLQKTEDSQYFNWAKNTALYTGVNEFTNTLGITTTYIPFLMTYWLLISVVYLIYDIALMMLHMAHNKIHQLEGSI